MKTTTTILGFFLSFSLFACPELAGRYTKCSSADGSILEIHIDQKTNAGITTYVISHVDAFSHESSSLTFIADGKSRVEKLPENNPDTQQINTIKCESNSLVAKAIVYLKGKEFSSVTYRYQKIDQKLLGQMALVFAPGAPDQGSSFFCTAN